MPEGSTTEIVVEKSVMLRHGMPPTAEEAPLARGTAIAALCLGVWLCVLGAAALAGIFETHVNRLAWLGAHGLHLPAGSDEAAELRLALLCMLGAVLGACLLSLLGLFQYAVVQTNFSLRYLGAYLIGPLAVSFLGLAAFVLVRAGLLSFGNVQDVQHLGSVNELSFLALGILTGLAWNHVLAKFSEVAGQLFTTTGPPVATGRSTRRTAREAGSDTTP